MWRYSMFKTMEELKEKIAMYINKPMEDFMRFSVLDSHLDKTTRAMYIMTPLEKTSLTNVKEMACINANASIGTFVGFTELDIGGIISYSCEYLMSKSSEQVMSVSEAINKWSDIDEEIKADENGLIINNYLKSVKNKKYDLLYNNIEIRQETPFPPTFCSGIALYILKNYKDVCWRKNIPNKSKEMFLYSNLAKTEKYKFFPSDYYVMENLTNVNSVMAITEFLERHLNCDEAENALNGEKFYMKNMVDELIDMVAKSPLIHSKALMIKKLIDDAELLGEEKFNVKLVYIIEQFSVLEPMMRKYVSDVVYKRFCDMAIGTARCKKKRGCPQISPEKTDEEIIKTIQGNDFNVLLHCYQGTYYHTLKNCGYFNKHLLKIKIENLYASSNGPDRERVNTKRNKINVYVQKKFYHIILDRVTLLGNNEEENEPDRKKDTKYNFVEKPSSAYGEVDSAKYKTFNVKYVKVKK